MMALAPFDLTTCSERATILIRSTRQSREHGPEAMQTLAGRVRDTVGCKSSKGS